MYSQNQGTLLDRRRFEVLGDVFLLPQHPLKCVESVIAVQFF